MTTRADAYQHSRVALEALRGRSFLKELDVSVDEWRALLDLSTLLKDERAEGREMRRLIGRNIALVIEKTATRTPDPFEVAAHDQGAHITYLDPAGSQFGHKESVQDIARALSRMCDGIEYRGFDQSVIEQLAAHASVPVWNGLTDQWHPTQSLGDVLTMTEHVAKPAADIAIAYIGDARNNIANSLAIAGAMTGMDVRLVAPETLWTDDFVIGAADEIAAETGARLMQTDDVAVGIDGVDFVYADVWLSMGEPPHQWNERIAALAPYSVTSDLMAKTGNPSAKVMHCLPAFDGLEKKVGREIFDKTGRRFLEVSDEVFESPQSIAVDQAENRLHTVKAVMVATIGA